MTASVAADRNSPDAIRRELLVRPLWVGLVIALILAALRALAEYNKGTAQPEFLSQMATFLPFTLIAPIFTTAVGLAIRHLQLNARFDEHVTNSATRLDAIEASISTSNLANQRIAQLEPHLRDEDDFTMMVRIASEWREINTLLGRFPDISDLIKWKINTILNELWRNWEKLGKGVMIISDSDQEFELNALILRLLKPKLVRAVSLYDEAYWLSAFGKSFLSSQKDYLLNESGREVRRVFFTLPDFDYSEIFAQQIAAGIKVKEISLAEIEKSKRKDNDVVIYDDRCLKISKLLGRGSNNGAELKEAELFFMNDRIEPAIRSFNDIWLAATIVGGVE